MEMPMGSPKSNSWFPLTSIQPRKRLEPSTMWVCAPNGLRMRLEKFSGKE